MQDLPSQCRVSARFCTMQWKREQPLEDADMNMISKPAKRLFVIQSSFLVLHEVEATGMVLKPYNILILASDFHE